MGIVTLAEFQKYVNAYDNPETQQGCLDAAYNLVTDYVGYVPELRTYTLNRMVKNRMTLLLDAKPVVEAVVRLDGVRLGEGDYEVSDNIIVFYPPITGRLLMDYRAGYRLTPPPVVVEDAGDVDAADDAEDLDAGEAETDSAFVLDGGRALVKKVKSLPAVFKSTTLRLAALLLTEASGNIGLTSRYFGDVGDRTFVNLTNYDKYLTVLSQYRLTRI